MQEMEFFFACEENITKTSRQRNNENSSRRNVMEIMIQGIFGKRL